MKGVPEETLNAIVPITVKPILMNKGQLAFKLIPPEKKLEHIVINDIRAVFTTYNHYHHYLGNDTVDLDEYLSQMPLETDEAYSLANSLLEQAVASLGEARVAHSFLENFYIPSMDFEGLEKKSNILIESIFN